MPEAGSVRKLAEFAGLSKSNVAKVEQQLVGQGVLIQSEKGFRLRDRSKLPEQLLRGYELALRPKRLLGRFRSPARKSMKCWSPSGIRSPKTQSDGR
jgi:biotin operon repressor